MKHEVPILQRIHDTFDVYKKSSHADHSVIATAEIATDQRGYSITTYPEGCGFFDGFVIKAEVEGGMFSGKSPARVETFREMKKGSHHVAQEELVLPGDSGYVLFEELRDKAEDLRSGFEDIIESVKPKFVAGSMKYSYKPGSEHILFDSVILYGSTVLEAKDRLDTVLNVELDATQEIPKNPLDELVYKKPEEVIYRAGTATVDNDGIKVTRVLEREKLDAFATLHREVEKLYK